MIVVVVFFYDVNFKIGAIQYTIKNVKMIGGGRMDLKISYKFLSTNEQRIDSGVKQATN